MQWNNNTSKKCQIRFKTKRCLSFQLDLSGQSAKRRMETWDCWGTQSAWLLQAPLTFKTFTQTSSATLITVEISSCSVIYTTRLPEYTKNKKQMIHLNTKYDSSSECYLVPKQGSLATHWNLKRSSFFRGRSFVPLEPACKITWKPILATQVVGEVELCNELVCIVNNNYYDWLQKLRPNNDMFLWYTVKDICVIIPFENVKVWDL